MRWLKLGLMLTGLVIGLTLAGVWTGYRLGHDRLLGPPLTRIGGMRVYGPWAFPRWYARWGTRYPRLFRHGLGISAGALVLGICAAVYAERLSHRGLVDAKTFGSRRFASRKDVAKMGLMREDGFVIGRWGTTLLRHNGPEHVICVAPTRSGKGVGLVVPTLLEWPHSAVIHDIKGENWDLTSGWHSTFGACYCFNPASISTHQFNPLSEIRMGTYEVKDAQNIADILVDPEGEKERRDHWEKTAHALLVGAILHLIYVERDKTLAGLAHFLSQPDCTFEDTLAAMMATSHTPHGCHPVVAGTVRELCNKSGNELSGVLSTAMSFLGLYRDPMIARATAKSDFHLADFQRPGCPVSLYLGSPPSDISRTRALMRLVINQLSRRLTEELDADAGRVMLLLDEFPSLGRLDFLQSALGYLAGYGVRAFLIAQSTLDIDRLYGRDSTLFGNCHLRVVFAPNDDRVAQRISSLLGDTTVLRHQHSVRGDRLAPMLLDERSVSESEAGRRLLTPGEIMELPKDDALIFVGGSAPIRAKKVRYYTRKRFTARMMPPPSILMQGEER